MDLLKFEEAAKELTSWAQTATNEILVTLPQAREGLQPGADIGTAPSPEATAEMYIRGIGSSIEEVMGAYDRLYEALGLQPRFAAYFK